MGDVTDGGKRSVRSLSGLRRDSEVMYVPKYEIAQAGNAGRRGRISGLFENDPDGGRTGSSGRRLSRGVGGSEPEDDNDNEDEDDENGTRLSRSLSQPDYINQAGLYQSGSSGGPRVTNQGSISSREHTGGVSIFERPGFGSVAFRKNMNSTLSNLASFSPQYSINNNSSNSQQNNKNNKLAAKVNINLVTDIIFPTPPQLLCKPNFLQIHPTFSFHQNNQSQSCQTT